MVSTIFTYIWILKISFMVHNTHNLEVIWKDWKDFFHSLFYLSFCYVVTQKVTEKTQPWNI